MDDRGLLLDDRGSPLHDRVLPGTTRGLPLTWASSGRPWTTMDYHLTAVDCRGLLRTIMDGHGLPWDDHMDDQKFFILDYRSVLALGAALPLCAYR